MTRGDFWAGIALLVVKMWILRVALEREFIKSMQRLIDFIDALDRKRRN